MSKAGLTAPAPGTELLASAGPRRQGNPGFALGIQDNWVTQMVLYALVATTVYGPDRTSTRRCRPARRRSPARLDHRHGQVHEMDKTGCFQKNPLGTSYEASQELAATGKTSASCRATG
jgi:raffinose/stachyose/melibiose transport system substrate-binding protein